MTPRRIGILHPGEMGAVAAASLLSGNEVWWASEDRSPKTRERAAQLNLKDSVTITALADRCEAIVSVCPPEFADDLADQIAATNFRGLYVDANAISPARVRAMDRRLTASGITFVDGGIIGLASMTPGKVRLYLSGESAPEAAKYFGAPMHTEILPGEIGQASALKICYAAYNKVLTALLAAVRATADQEGVLELLERQPAWPQDAARRIAGSIPKAWRFVPEMQEIAATFESAGVSPAFPKAAAEIYALLQVAQASACESSK
jgi:3-hydroxyisobutyrate dehydrogenase-like beta-hydroxyacid dehydrogenase